VRSLSHLSFALLLCVFALKSPAQQPTKDIPKALTLYGNFRELLAEGRYDIAANYLEAFLKANPTDSELLDLEKKFGTTVFYNLRTIPKWSDDTNVDKQARANVEKLIARSQAANAKLLQDPSRVQKYINNLGATYEERVFAELELKRTGDYAVPFMVNELRITRDKEVYAGILGAIKQLNSSTISGWVAALDGLSPDQQYGVISAILQRPDVLSLQQYAQTDLTPVLWHILSRPSNQYPALRSFAEDTLQKLKPGIKITSSQPEAELTAIARSFYDRTSKYSGSKTNPDGSSTVPIWVWDAKDPVNPRLVKLDDVPVGNAEEYYGLRYARWALERQPSYEPAQALILALSAERAVERAGYANLARAEPATFKLLSEAPSVVLNELLNRGLNQNKTALVLAMVQVLGDRADRDAATPPAGLPNKPSLLVRALSYPDPQVQFEAANALLRSPVPVPTAARGQIVDILRRAAGLDPGIPSGSKGIALLADPNKRRSDSFALLLRGLEYEVEVLSTGRDLLRRIARSSDFDLIFIDRHIVAPELLDLVGQLSVDAKLSNRPTFVIASPDKTPLPTFDQLLVRFAALIAATENEVVAMLPVFVPDPRDTPEEISIARKTNQERRDGVFLNTATARMDRLKRLVETSGINLTQTQKLLYELRVELITYSVLGAEFPISAESAPATYAHIQRLKRQIASQPPSPPYGVGTPTADLIKLLERFEIDLARVPSAQQRFENLYSKIDTAELGLPVETFRDPNLELRVAKTLQNYPAIRIIPEPYSRTELASDLKAAFTHAHQAPRDLAEKRAAQQVAVAWLRRMATGELSGFDVKVAEPELRAALRVDALANDAIPAVERFGTAEAQQDLLSLALTQGRPIHLRTQAADAAIRNIQAHGRSVPKSLIDPLVQAADKEPDLVLRGKLLTLKGMLAYQPLSFVNQLNQYSPPLLPPPPGKNPAPATPPQLP